MKLRELEALLREVWSEWSVDTSLSHGAALAFYAVISMAPLLVLVIAIAGLVFGREAAQGEIVGQIEGAVGAQAAELIQGVIERASAPASGIVATLLSLATMIFGASGVFGQLQISLNQIWGAVSERRAGFVGGLKRRAASVGMILALGLLLLLSLALSGAVGVTAHWVQERLPITAIVLQYANLAVSLASVTLLFALIFKLLPDARIEWRDVWLGAILASLLFAVGRGAIGLYLGRAGIASVYGAAGSLVLILLWVYYSAQILFLGAEFTEVYSRRFGSRARLGRGEA